MPEPTDEYWKELTLIFLPEYNRVNEESFSWSYERLAGEPSDREYKDPQGNVLEVQLVEAVGTTQDLLKQKIRPKTVEKIIGQLKDELVLRGIEKVYCDINFHNPPRDHESQRELVYWLAHAIEHFKSKRLKSPAYFEFDLSDFEDYIEPIDEWVSSLSIMPWRKKIPMFSFSSFEHPISASGVLDCPQRFENAVNKKIEQRYDEVAVKKLVLLVSFVDFPFDQRDLEEIKARAVALKPPFKSIWIIQRWQPGKAIEVYKSI